MDKSLVARFLWTKVWPILTVTLSHSIALQASALAPSSPVTDIAIRQPVADRDQRSWINHTKSTDRPTDGPAVRQNEHNDTQNRAGQQQAIYCTTIALVPYIRLHDPPVHGPTAN